MNKKILYLLLTILFSANLNYNSAQADSIAIQINKFNSSLKKNVEINLYLNNGKLLLKENIRRYNANTLSKIEIDKNYDFKYEKSIEIYTIQGKNKVSLLSSPALNLFDGKVNYIKMDSEKILDPTVIVKDILNLDYLPGLINKDLTVNTSSLSMVKKTSNVVTLTPKDKSFYLDLLIRGGKIYSVDYYHLNPTHNTFLIYTLVENSKKIELPNKNIYELEKLDNQLKNYVENYNLIKSVGFKMSSSFLSVLSSSYINQPNSDLNNLFDELFKTLPESYLPYNPQIETLPSGLKAITFTLSDYSYCAYLTLDSNKAIDGSVIIADGHCIAKNK